MPLLACAPVSPLQCAPALPPLPNHPAGFIPAPSQIVESHAVLSQWGRHVRLLIVDPDEFFVPATSRDTVARMRGPGGCLAPLREECVMVTRRDVFPRKVAPPLLDVPDLACFLALSLPAPFLEPLQWRWAARPASSSAVRARCGVGGFRKPGSDFCLAFCSASYLVPYLGVPPPACLLPSPAPCGPPSRRGELVAGRPVPPAAVPLRLRSAPTPQTAAEPQQGAVQRMARVGGSWEAGKEPGGCLCSQAAAGPPRASLCRASAGC